MASEERSDSDVDSAANLAESPADGAQQEGEAVALTGQEIEMYLREVGADLDAQGLRGEILIVGGAFMAPVLHARKTHEGRRRGHRERSETAA